MLWLSASLKSIFLMLYYSLFKRFLAFSTGIGNIIMIYFNKVKLH